MTADPVTRGALVSASIGELAWVDPAGSPRVEGVTPLVLDGAPAIAFTYAHYDLAVEVAAASRVAISVTEARSTGAGFRALQCVGRPRLIRDAQADLFVDRLLEQELRRYPPARALADSALLRREHWWYLPRLVVVVDVNTVGDLPIRRPPGDGATNDHLLAVAGTDGVEVQVVTTSPGDDSGTLTATPASSTVAPSGPAVLFSQDASFPDLERWTVWSYHGRWDAASASFAVDTAPAAVGLEPIPSLLRRWRRHRDLERRCRAGLAAHT